MLDTRENELNNHFIDYFIFIFHLVIVTNIQLKKMYISVFFFYLTNKTILFWFLSSKYFTTRYILIHDYTEGLRHINSKLTILIK